MDNDDKNAIPTRQRGWRWAKLNQRKYILESVLRAMKLGIMEIDAKLKEDDEEKNK